MCFPHCRTAFTKPSTNSEENQEYQNNTYLTILLFINKN